MSLLVDKKYASLLSIKLENFKWIGDNKAQFRCPLCGDSKKNKFKTRGGFYQVKDILMMGCFNCGIQQPFVAFLKQIDYNLYKEYSLENYKYNNHKCNNVQIAPMVEQRFEEPCVGGSNPLLDTIPSISSLDLFHPAVKYVRDRKIPKKYWNILFYTQNYKKWINEYIEPNKFKFITKNEDERIVIPFYGRDNTIFAFQGRYIGKNLKNKRYITINPNPNNTLIYGIERIKTNLPIYVTEGPFDSLNLKNGLAVAGSALSKLLKYKNSNLIYIFDREPYSPEICKLMNKIIELDKKIVIWDNKFDDINDVNDLAVLGLSTEEIMKYIKSRTFYGLSSRLEFNQWKKI